jgi:F-type H+-transporting ATPase subunit delta
MKVSKSATAAARRLFGLCQIDGRLDETRLRSVTAKLLESQPRDYRGILHGILRLTRLEIARRAVTVESAVELDHASRERVAAGLTRQYGDGLEISYKITPELLGGLRIRVGNDVYDGSVKGRLDRLAAAF